MKQILLLFFVLSWQVSIADTRVVSDDKITYEKIAKAKTLAKVFVRQMNVDDLSRADLGDEAAKFLLDIYKENGKQGIINTIEKLNVSAVKEPLSISYDNKKELVLVDSKLIHEENALKIKLNIVNDLNEGQLARLILREVCDALDPDFRNNDENKNLAGRNILSKNNGGGLF